MSEIYSPEQDSFKEQSHETPTPAASSEDSARDSLERPDAHEAALLKEMRLRDKERFETLQRAERQLVRALAENPDPLYKQERLVVEKQDLPFWRLLDLEESLRDLGKFKEQLPGRYKTSADKVVEQAAFVKKIFEDYRSWAEKKAGYTPFAINDILIGPLVQLRRLDQDRFPRDLVAVTDKDFELLTLPITRRLGDGLQRMARMAEYDPARFRRLFAHEYSPEVIADQKAYWTSVDERNPGRTDFSAAWEKIERTLQKKDQEEAQAKT